MALGLIWQGSRPFHVVAGTPGEDPRIPTPPHTVLSQARPQRGAGCHGGSNSSRDREGLYFQLQEGTVPWAQPQDWRPVAQAGFP